ncbi:hypothetical protein A8C56_20940 [Niabella ginsenosidivorans]|uniref:Uncharacterized protein n=1 Tax=Niabella ginsenosidivorans TaxID=1176587 RepID=A0A1A9I5Z5_9BACT|nr:hypothetical protein A8C56_20940 [Niabella ginsenosidivorans]
MKWFVYLFAFYVLLLSGIPCKADDGCCMEEITQMYPMKKQAPDTAPRPACPCSPFFACGACHGVTLPRYHIEFSCPLPANTQLHAVYTEQFLFYFLPSIWQPPKTA